MIRSESNRTRIAALCVLCVAVLLIPAASHAGKKGKESDIPGSLALSLSNTRKRLDRAKQDLISGWSTQEQRRYLLYVGMIEHFPDKLYGDDTVEKLIPPEDLPIVGKWPKDDQIRLAHHFKKKVVERGLL